MKIIKLPIAVARCHRHDAHPVKGIFFVAYEN